MWEGIKHVNHCQISRREERVRLMRLKSTLTSALNEIFHVIWCKKSWGAARHKAVVSSCVFNVFFNFYGEISVKLSLAAT